MHGLVRATGRTVTTFDPERTHETISVLRAAIQHAKQMEDWQAGRDAAQWMAEEQRLFVAWWDASVRPHGGNRSSSAQTTALELLPYAEAERKTKVKHQQVSRWRKEIGRPGYVDRLFRPSHATAMADGAQRRADLQTGEMEWFTPAIYIKAARSVLGGIDVDPASCAQAQRKIKAKKFYSATNDGLTKQWRGRVWLNPPYSGALVAAFAKKMIASCESGETSAAIMLTNAYTETSWFHALAQASTAMCFTRGRIKFESPHGEKSAPTNGQSFFYFGRALQSFSAKFKEFGLIVVKA